MMPDAIPLELMRYVLDKVLGDLTQVDVLLPDVFCDYEYYVL